MFVLKSIVLLYSPIQNYKDAFLRNQLKSLLIFKLINAADSGDESIVRSIVYI